MRHTIIDALTGRMKAYSIDLREKIVKAYEQGDTSIRKVAERFGVAKSFVQKLLSLKKTQGHVEPKKQGGAMKGELDGCGSQLAAMVEKYPDATLLEYCEYWGETYDHWVSPSTICRGLQKQNLTLKKRPHAAAKHRAREFKLSELSTGSKSNRLIQRT